MTLWHNTAVFTPAFINTQLFLKAHPILTRFSEAAETSEEWKPRERAVLLGGSGASKNCMRMEWAFT